MINKDDFGCLLKAVVHGPFFIDHGAPDDQYWEFSCLFGYNIKQLRCLLDNIDGTYLDNGDYNDLIMGIIVNLRGYPHGMESEISKWVPRFDEIQKIV